MWPVMEMWKGRHFIVGFMAVKRAVDLVIGWTGKYCVQDRQRDGGSYFAGGGPPPWLRNISSMSGGGCFGARQGRSGPFHASWGFPPLMRCLLVKLAPRRTGAGGRRGRVHGGAGSFCPTIRVSEIEPAFVSSAMRMGGKLCVDHVL